MSELYNICPICPYCGGEIINPGELGLDSDGEATETECGECGEGLIVSINVSVTFNTYKKEGLKL